MADEPDTRSSPGAGRYEDAPDTSSHANPKNNGYDKGTVNDGMMESLSNDQGAEGPFRFPNLQITLL